MPAFLFKRDVIPTITNQFDIHVEKAGAYRGYCAEFCGLDHARMTFTVRAVSRAEYDDWVARAIVTTTLDRPTAALPEPAPEPTGLLGWLTTTDHKRIGLSYIFTAIGFFCMGGVLALLIRSAARPTQRAPRRRRRRTTSSSRCTAAS